MALDLHYDNHGGIEFVPNKILKYSQTVAAYSRLYETPEDLVSHNMIS